MYTPSQSCGGLSIITYHCPGPLTVPLELTCPNTTVFVAILEEGPLTPLAALRNVVGDAGQDHAGKSSHDSSLTSARRRVNLGVYGRVTVIPEYVSQLVGRG